MPSSNALQVFYPQKNKDAWSELQAACPTPISIWGSGILKSGLNRFAGSIVLEPIYFCKDHRNLHSNFYSKKFEERKSTCSRLHFFGSEDISRSDLFGDLEQFQESYIGYSVIRPVAARCIGRTVVDPWKLGKSIASRNYVLRTPFRTHLNARRINAIGYPYLSQDTEATVCAHTALWGMCRYLSERYPIYPETYPYDLITATDDTHGRVVPYRGMTYADYSSLLSQFGCHPEIILMKDGGGRVLSQSMLQLYSYVESGFPVLASYNGHVVSIVGHTLDLGRSPAVDSRGWIDSSGFLKQYIVVDDNSFPYQLLGDEDDCDNYGKLYNTANRPGGFSLDSLYAAVCPLPEKIYLTAKQARTKAEVLLKNIVTQYSKDLFAGTNDPLVTRLFATTSGSFKRRKLESTLIGTRLSDPFSVKLAEWHLPHFIWVMEIGPLNLYKQGRFTAEIVLDTTANMKEDGLIYARVGETLLLNTGAIAATKPQLRRRDFPQYTHNLGEI